MYEGKLSIWLKSGKFDARSDLYVTVNLDKKTIWKTDESSDSSPEWNSSTQKHLKGEYSSLFITLLDEDTFSRDDVLGTCEIPMSTVVSKGVNGQIELTNKDGEPVGTVDLSLSFEEGDVSVFDLFASKIHDSDSD